MNRQDNHIKNLMDNFQLQDYDTENGWEKLRKKQKVKTGFIYYAAIAASVLGLVFIMIFYINTNKEKSSKPVSIVKIIHPQKNITKSDDTVSGIKNETVAVNNKPVLSKKTTNTILSKEKNSFETVQNNIISENQSLPPEPIIESTHDKNIIAANTNAAQKETTKPMVLSEDEFNALVANSEPSAGEKKKSKIMDYIISHSEQKEYTTQKATSTPIQIKF